MIRDMTKGNPAKLIFFFSVPMLLGNLFQQMYSMVDSIIVGKGIGVKALAAVGAVTSLDWAILGFSVGLTQGFAILIAQSFGAEDFVRLRRVLTQSVLLTAGIGLVMTAASILGAMPLLKLLNTPGDIIEDAHRYIVTIFAGILISVFYNLCAGILRALGDSRTPLIAVIFASFINIILDYVFVMVWKVGITGAAYATLTAQLFSLIFCFLQIRRLTILRTEAEEWKPDKGLMGELLKIGVPVGIQNAIISLGTMILQVMVNAYGSLCVAGYTAAIKIFILIEQPLTSYGQAMTTYVGQNFGAGLLPRVRLGLRKCLKISLITCALLMAFIYTCAPFLISIMIDPSELEATAYAKDYLFITMSMLPWLALLHVYRSSLQGLGNTVVPMISGGLELLARMGFALILPKLMGYAGVCVSEFSAWIAAAILLIWGYYRMMRRLEAAPGIRESSLK